MRRTLWFIENWMGNAIGKFVSLSTLTDVGDRFEKRKKVDGRSCYRYGLLNESDVNDLLDDAISTRPETDTTLYSNWRGRLGLSSDATKAQYSSSTSTRDKKKQVQELGEKVEIKFVTFDGDELNLVGYEGESLMQVAKRGDAPSILATCGGNCEVKLQLFFPSLPKFLSTLELD